MMYKEGEIATVGKTFRNEDITHKPRRFQNATVAQSQPQIEEQTATQASNHAYTLEGAITYFEANSSLMINKQTCAWLKEYRELKLSVKNAGKEGEENE